MAAQFADRIRVNTTTTGTGTVTLGTAILGFRTFLAAVTAGALTSPASVYYVIEDTGGAWEVGSGVYTTGVETLTRVVAASSLGGTILTLSGAAQVYLALTAASVMTDNITSGTISGVTINSSTIGQTTANLGTFTALTATGATSLASLTATGSTTPSTSLAVGTPTGGAMGTGTINATALYVNGTAISGSVIAASAPTSPASGALWWNTGDDKLYIWVGSAWSEATNETVPIASTSVPGTVIAGAGLAVTTTGLLSVAAPVGISVMSYGATGNGTTDDSTAINNAIAAAVTAGGGVVYFPPGTYAIGSTIVLQSLVTLRGAGRTATTIEGLSGTTMDLVQTHQFTTLTGSNTAAGPYRFGIMCMSLNGNARNGGRCVAIYGYNYIIEDAEFFGAHGDGFYSEWSTSGLVPVTAGGESMEAHFFRTTFYSNGGNGLTFNGPHDTILTDTLTFLNKGSGAVFQQSPTYIGACVIMGMHSYGNSQVGVIIGTGCYAAQLQSENNRATGGILVSSPTGQLNGTGIVVFENTGYGISFAGATSTIASIFSYDNSGDGVVVSGLNNTLSDVSATHSTAGNGINILSGATGTTINGISCVSNYYAGIAIASNDTRVRDCFVNFNSQSGIEFANGVSGVSVSGEVNNNTGIQVAFATLGGACFMDLYIYTSASPQVAWSGNTGANDVRIIAAGYDARSMQFSSDLLPTITATTNVGSSTNTFNNVWAVSLNASAGCKVGSGAGGGGYFCKSGLTGAFDVNQFNMHWTGGAMQLWVDGTNLGPVTVSSDARYKQDIAPITDDALARVMALKPVSYQFADRGIFAADGVTREGFLTQDLLGVIPSAVAGDPDGDSPQSVNLLPILSVMVKAVQELKGEVDRLREAPGQCATLEARMEGR